MRKIILGMVFLTCFILPYLSGQAFGQDAYPTKPIDLFVGVPPGGGWDLTARLLSGYFAKVWKVQLNVINKPGGSGIVATREVLVSKPDGYTMIVEQHGSPMLAAFLPGELPFDWRKRTWIARITKDPLVYEVRGDAPWKSLKEVAAFIKEHSSKQKLNWGSTGLAGISNPAVIQFLRASKLSLDMVNSVKFSGEAPVLTALAGSHIDLAAQQYAASLSLIEGKKIRALAVVSGKRLPGLPEVPTVAEAGYPMLDVFGWHGVAGPPGIPKHIVEFWAKSLEKASTDPVFREMAEKVNKDVAYLGPQEFVDFVEREYQKFAEMAKDPLLK